jgi:hypothetical protein
MTESFKILSIRLFHSPSLRARATMPQPCRLLPKTHSSNRDFGSARGTRSHSCLKLSIITTTKRTFTYLWSTSICRVRVSVEYEYLSSTSICRVQQRPKDWYAVGMGGLNTSLCGSADLCKLSWPNECMLLISCCRPYQRPGH